MCLKLNDFRVPPQRNALIKAAFSKRDKSLRGARPIRRTGPPERARNAVAGAKSLEFRVDISRRRRA